MYPPLSQPVYKNKVGLLLTAYLSLPALLIVSTITTIPILLIYGFAVENLPIIPILLATVLAELAVIFAAVLIAGERKSFKDTFALRKPSRKGLAVGIGYGVISFVLLQVIDNLIRIIFGFQAGNSDTSDMIASVEGSARLLTLLLFVPFIVPFVEELFFRGFVLGFLVRGGDLENHSLRTSSMIFAILTSAFFFAVVHLQGFSSYTDVLIPVWIFVMACGLAILRLKYNSLFVSFAAHAAYNLSTSLIILFA